MGKNVRYLMHDLQMSGALGYYLDYQPTHTYLTRGGGHEIQLETEEVCLTGGAFSLCLGETARDSILFGRFPKAARLTFYGPAIYGNFDGPTTTTLQSQLVTLQDRDIIPWLRAKLFTSSIALGRQNTEERCTTGLNLRFDILMDGRKLGTIESLCRSPQHPRRIVELNFVTKEGTF